MSGARWLDAGAPRRLIEVASRGAEDVLTREQSQATIEQTLQMSTADEARVTLGSNYTGNVRFADNRVSTAGATTNLSLTVFSTFGRKQAVASTNDISAEGLRSVVRRSEALARLAPDNPELMPELGPQTYLPVESYVPATAGLTAEQRAMAARVALDAARAAGELAAAGFIVAGAASNALGNSKGLFAYHRETNGNYTVTARTSDGTGSGWAGADHPDWSRIDFAAVTQRAIEKARLSRNPKAVEPGRYTVILEPQAAADLLQLISGSAAARLADEGRSAFAKPGGGTRVGEKIVDERVTIFSDPTNPMLLGQPFDFQGLPLLRRVWIENGVLKQLPHDRFWASRKQTEPTGFPTTFMMEGGNATLEEMIASTPRGLLVTRLWYLRQVDPRTILYTGLTRDGTFLIENGKISHAVKNLRFNESPLFILNNLEMIGRPARVAGTEAGGDIVVPALKVRNFNFTSLSDAV